MDEWVPAQDKVPEIHDFRASKTGPKGYKERTKRKLEEMEELHAQDQEQAAARMESDDAAMEEDAKQPSSKRGKGEDGAKFIPVSAGLQMGKVVGPCGSGTLHKASVLQPLLQPSTTSLPPT